MKKSNEEVVDDLDRRAKVQTSFDASVAPDVVNIYFLPCIFQRREALALVKSQHIQAVLSFNSAIVFRRADTDPPVLNTKFCERCLKACRLFAFLPEQGMGEHHDRCQSALHGF